MKKFDWLKIVSMTIAASMVLYLYFTFINFLKNPLAEDALAYGNLIWVIFACPIIIQILEKRRRSRDPSNGRSPEKMETPGEIESSS